MRSMTGYGRGAAEIKDARATVEVRTVNHRFLDLKLRGGALPAVLEEAVTARVRGSIERGSVIVSIHHVRAGELTGPRLDEAAAARVYQQLAALARKLGTDAPQLALAIQQPGVMVLDEPVVADDRDILAESPVLPALDAALAQLAGMRLAEGAALAIELHQRLDELSTVRTQVATLAATVPGAVAKRLHERVAKLLAQTAELAPAPADGSPRPAPVLDPARLAQEIALLADRSDITEELVRLASHLDQCRALVDSTTAGVGRRLDFLVQELGRELNTIGSKSAAAEITTAIVSGKAALEKLREQVQNVE